MKYAVIKCINDSFSIDSEWTDKEKAIMQWHNVCRTLWATQDVESATVEIVDKHLQILPVYTENIKHEPVITE